MKSSTKVSNYPHNSRQTIEKEWDIAVQDAEIELEELKKKKTRLAHALSVFRANKRDGISWPGKSSSLS